MGFGPIFRGKTNNVHPTHDLSDGLFLTHQLVPKRPFNLLPSRKFQGRTSTQLLLKYRLYVRALDCWRLLGGHDRPEGQSSDFDPARGAVQELDRLVRQEPVADETDRQVNGSFNGIVLDDDALSFFDAPGPRAQNPQCIFAGGLAHAHEAETAQEGGVGLDIPIKLGLSGCANAPNFSPPQRWLKKVGDIDCTLPGPTTHCQMDLIEEEYKALVLFCFIEDASQALFEITAKLRAAKQMANR